MLQLQFIRDVGWPEAVGLQDLLELLLQSAWDGADVREVVAVVRRALPFPAVVLTRCLHLGGGGG